MGGTSGQQTGCLCLDLPKDIQLIRCLPAAGAAPQVPLSRIVALNKPELPAAITGMLGSAGLGMMMPGFAIAFSSILAVFYGPGERRQGGGRGGGRGAGV